MVVARKSHSLNGIGKKGSERADEPRMKGDQGEGARYSCFNWCEIPQKDRHNCKAIEPDRAQHSRDTR